MCNLKEYTNGLHLNPFEFFDHSVLQKHTDKEFIMN
jgi:hypothetical protein